MMEQPPSVINPDGVPFIIPWGDFGLGESVFIPCIKVDTARGQMANAGKRYGMTFTSKVQIENGMLGLRVWRIA